MTYQHDIDHLRDCLADPECTDWTCPECGHVESKGAVVVATGERIQFRLECDECGFDAKSYAPTERAALAQQSS